MCALDLGWSANDSRDSYWRGDPSVDWEGTPEAEQLAYLEDGDGSHLKLKDGKATKIVFRTLTAQERAAVVDLCTYHPPKNEGESHEDYAKRLGLETKLEWNTLLLLCFRVGVSFPDVDPKLTKPERLRKLSVLPDKLCNQLARALGPGLITFYGGLVWSGATLLDSEKKTSSPGVIATSAHSSIAETA